jgi:hypothetical protein
VLWDTLSCRQSFPAAIVDRHQARYIIFYHIIYHCIGVSRDSCRLPLHYNRLLGGRSVSESIETGSLPPSVAKKDSTLRSKKAGIILMLLLSLHLSSQLTRGGRVCCME